MPTTNKRPPHTVRRGSPSRPGAAPGTIDVAAIWSRLTPGPRLAIELALAAFALWQLRLPSRTSHVLPWVLLLASSIAIALSIRSLASIPRGASARPAVQDAPTHGRRQWIGLSLITIAVLLSVVEFVLMGADNAPWRTVTVLWVIALLTFPIGAWLTRLRPAERNTSAPRLLLWTEHAAPRPWELAVVLGILALGIFLRVFQLASIPPGIWVDETNAGLDALKILEGRFVSPFGMGWYNTPNLYFYYMALVFRLLGPTWLALKVVSLLPAILLLPAIYLLAREMFGPLPAFVAMFLLAVSRWHITLSRWGWNELLPPVFQVLAFYFLLQGLRRRSTLRLAAAGMLAGLSIYTYVSARLSAAFFGAFLLYWLVTETGGLKKVFKRHWLGVLIVVLGFAVAVAPLAAFYAGHPDTFSLRTNELSVFREMSEKETVQPLVQNGLDVVRFFHEIGDRNGRHNLPGEPMLDPFTGLFFLVGIVLAAMAWRDRRSILLLLWVVIGLAGSYLSRHDESPQAYRSLTALPGVILLAGAALTHFARAAGRIKRPRSLRWLTPAWAFAAVLSAALIGAGVWEAVVYFGPQARSARVAAAFNETENGVAREIVSGLQANREVYVTPRLGSFSITRFLTYDPAQGSSAVSALDQPPYRILAPFFNFPLPSNGRPVLLLLESQFWPLQDYFARLYPHAAMTLVPISNGSAGYMRVEIPAEEIAQLTGLHEQLTLTDGTSQSRIVPQPTFDGDPTTVTSATWDGLIRLDHDGEYSIGGQGGLQVFVEGAPWTRPAYLMPGTYRLHLSWQPQTPANRPSLYWQPPGAERSEVPAQVLFHTDGPPNGTLTEYFWNAEWDGEPAFRQLVPFIYLGWTQIPAPAPKGAFSVRFTGSLLVSEPGNYRFRVEADDGARLFLDGDLLGEGVIPGRGNTFESAADLQPGAHPMELYYFQMGGANGVKLLWARGDEAFSPIPPSALVPPSDPASAAP